MSLLIDALKKAEQEKKEAAKRLKEAQEKSGGHYQLEEPTDRRDARTSIENENSEEASASDAPALEMESVDEPVQETEITGENELQSPEDNSLAEEPAPAGPSAETTIAEPVELSLDDNDDRDETLQHAEISDEDEEDFGNDISPGRKDETFALTSLSLEEDASAPHEADAPKHIIDDTRSETIGDTRIDKSVVSAEALVRDMGSGREAPTPVAAQTVFTAVARSSERRQFLEWMLFLGLVTIIIMATGAFYYLKVTPLTPETSSPLVAKGVEADTDQPLNIDLPQADTQQAVSGEISADEPALSTVKPDETSSDEIATTNAEITKPVMPSSEEAAASEMPAVVKNEPAGTNAAAAPSPDKQPDTGKSPAVSDVAKKTLPDQIPLDQSAIAISRSRSVSTQDQMVSSAYAAYIAGDYTKAGAEYSEVLEKHPGNRDALLGIAAVAYRRGDLQSAFENYLRVLKYFPNDAVATAAIIDMQGNTDNVRAESTLKLLIDKNPDAAYLHFILGNVYANSARWADAQQAFFDAFRLQPLNADYAYNLAVSLDHLGQRKAAGDYYRTALDLADKNQAAFNTAAAISRISSLSEMQDKR